MCAHKTHKQRKQQQAQLSLWQRDEKFTSKFRREYKKAIECNGTIGFIAYPLRVLPLYYKKEGEFELTVCPYGKYNRFISNLVWEISPFSGILRYLAYARYDRNYVMKRQKNKRWCRGASVCARKYTSKQPGRHTGLPLREWQNKQQWNCRGATMCAPKNTSKETTTRTTVPLIP